MTTPSAADPRHENPSWNRRRFLKGLGLGAALWPFVPPLSSFAAPGDAPTRLLVFYHPHGVASGWFPSGTEHDFALSPALAPLAPFQDRLVVVGGLSHAAALTGPGDSHQRGTQNLLTGTAMTGGLLPGGPSLDQVVAAQIGQDTAYPSLESATVPYVFPGIEALCASGPDQPIPMERDPYQQYVRVFGAFEHTEEELERLRAERGSVLDFVEARLEALTPAIASEDRPKIEAHLQAVRDIEHDLDTLGLLPPGCGLPMLAPGANPSANAHIPLLHQLHTDVLVAAFACDITRVATLQLGVNGGENFADWLPGIDDAYHPTAHDAIVGQPGKMEQYRAMNVWVAEQLASVLAKLDAIPEGDGTLLDHTLVLWCTSMANGGHGMHDMPFLLAGGAGGLLQTGRYLRYEATAHNALLVSVARLMGLGVDVFGDPALGAGGLAGIA